MKRYVFILVFTICLFMLAACANFDNFTQLPVTSDNIQAVTISPDLPAVVIEDPTYIPDYDTVEIGQTTSDAEIALSNSDDSDALATVRALLRRGNTANIIASCNFFGYSPDENGWYRLDMKNQEFKNHDIEQFSTTADIIEYFQNTFTKSAADKFLAPITKGLNSLIAENSKTTDIFQNSMPLYCDIDGKLYVNALAPAVPLVLGEWSEDNITILSFDTDKITIEAEIIFSYMPFKCERANIKIIKENDKWLLDESFAVSFIEHTETTQDMDSLNLPDYKTANALYIGWFKNYGDEDGDGFAEINLDAVSSNMREVLKKYNTIEKIKDFIRYVYTEKPAEEMCDMVDQMYKMIDGKLYINLNITISPYNGMLTDEKYIVESTDKRIVIEYGCREPYFVDQTFYRLIYYYYIDGYWKITDSIDVSSQFHSVDNRIKIPA